MKKQKKITTEETRSFKSRVTVAFLEVIIAAESRGGLGLQCGRLEARDKTSDF
jgi:hypothetical protein